MGTDQEQNVLELSTGVKLQLKRPSPMLIMEATKELMQGEPKPPKVFIEAKEREEENPNDPNYIAEHNLWMAQVGVRALRALIPTGTLLLSKPDDMVGPGDEDYDDLMAAIGQVPAQGRYSRYVQWVMSVACSGSDLATLSVRLMRLAGIPEEDVADVLGMFPSIEERVANLAGTAERGNPDGDPVPDPPAPTGVPGRGA